MTDWQWPNSIVVRVIDGDTFVGRVTRDLGFGGSATFEVKLRLNRINTPAASSVKGKAATDATKLLLASGPVDITTLRTYKYGGGDTSEWMAEVTLPDGRNLSDVLVAGGFAVPWDGEGIRPGD